MDPDGVGEASGGRTSVNAGVLGFRVVYRQPILPVPLVRGDRPTCETDKMPGLSVKLAIVCSLYYIVHGMPCIFGDESSCLQRGLQFGIISSVCRCEMFAVRYDVTERVCGSTNVSVRCVWHV